MERLASFGVLATLHLFALIGPRIRERSQIEKSVFRSLGVGRKLGGTPRTDSGPDVIAFRDTSDFFIPLL